MHLFFNAQKTFGIFRNADVITTAFKRSFFYFILDVVKVSPLATSQQKTGAAIEKAAFEEITDAEIEESEPRPVEHPVFEALAPGKARPLFFIGGFKPFEAVGLPCGIFIVLFQIVFQASEIVMLNPFMKSS